jgi:glycosyltransferase involved in cell wall biosynthesis
VRIPDGVPVPAGGAPAPGFGYPLRLTVVGGLDPRKGQDVAVEALARLRGHGLDAKLELVGRDVDPSFGERLRERSRELGLAERVTFCGERPDADAALADADIVLAPSRDEWTPLVVMEALARGKPVIASSVGGMVELVADGRTGILVAPDDSDGLAREVLRLAASPGSAREMAANGRREVAARFSIERSLDALENELRRTLDAA